MADSQDPRRAVPRMDAVLDDPALSDATARLGRALVKQVAEGVLADVRAGAVDPSTAAEAALARLPAAATSLQPVLNATGVVLHTNLGRAPLSPAAVTALQLAAGYVDVEFDLDSGQRASRGRGALDALRRAVPAAGDALVVNNGAAALLLATTALAPAGRIVVSRGELVEIGDGFRLPDLLATTGAKLHEVGTTNRTGLEDYRAALAAPAADGTVVLKVHPSNFRIEGFTSAVPTAELAGLGVPLVVDVGSGMLHPDPQLPEEPDVTSALLAGAAAVTCSADKLLGGPQAGLIFGPAPIVARIRRHPLARALRADKLTLAALEATVAGPTPPARDFLRIDADALRRRSDATADAVRASVAADVVASDGVVGGGGAPGLRLPGWAVALPEALAAPLRHGTPAVIGRLDGGRCLLDLRCVRPEDDHLVVAAVIAAVSATGGR